MTAQILKLHNARLAKSVRPAAEEPVLELAELAYVVRNRFQLPRGIETSTIEQSLAEIRAAHGDYARWRAAFNSTLGLFLSLRAPDFDGAMRTLISLVPHADA